MSPRRTSLFFSCCALGCDPRVVRVQAVDPADDAELVAPEAAEAGVAEPLDARTAGSGEEDSAVDGSDGSLGADGCPGGPIDVPAPSASAASLFLRYDFSGMGSAVRDRVGDAQGVILGGAELDCSGSLSFDGLDDFVDMPNGLLAGHQSLTAMAWITWPKGSIWQRVFAFGNTERGEGNPGSALTSISLTPRSYSDKLFGMYEREGLHGFERRELQVNDAPTQVALVFDGATKTLSVYQRGELDGSTTIPFALGQIIDIDNWLGRSHWVADPYFRGVIHEFRLYDQALGEAEIAEANGRGMEAP